MKTILLALATLAVAAGGATAKGIKLEVPYEQFRLDNGLNVILHRDPSTPVISINLWFHVGSAYEKPHRTGFAHLFEHIMFEGSGHVPEGMFDEWFEAVGASTNGWTSNDYTTYVETFSSSALDLALFLESDRMGYQLDAMSEASVDGQRDVVKNERRQSYENRPYGLAWETLGEALYPQGHPYHWPVIGYMDDLSAAGYGDVVDFFSTYYRPNNASLVIAGDIDYDEARALVEKWFGEIPRGPDVERVVIENPVLEEESRLLLEDEVQLPRLYSAWLTPPFYKPGDAAADVTSEILAGDKNSRLYKRLVYELQIAQDVTSFVDSGFSSQLIVVVTAREGTSLEELRVVMDEEIERLRNEPPTAREVQRVVNVYEASFLERVEQLDRRADMLNRYYYYVGDPNYFDKDLARYEDLKPKDIQDFARTYLQNDRRILLSIVPTGDVVLAATGSVPVSQEGVEQ